jgi:hypothetical protein
MSDWFHSLPIAWMALLVFGFTYFVVAVIYAVVHLLAVGERARAFKLVSPGMLPRLGRLEISGTPGGCFSARTQKST